MFSLIITIISIALVTALALATIYYGGSAFRQGGDAAQAARLINEGQQLAGAAQIAEATAAVGATVDFAQTALVTGNQLQSAVATYATAPVLVSTSPLVRGYTAIVASDAICQRINEKAGRAYTNASEAAGADVVSAVNTYGCEAVADVGTGAPGFVMAFRF